MVKVYKQSRDCQGNLARSMASKHMRQEFLYDGRDGSDHFYLYSYCSVGSNQLENQYNLGDRLNQKLVEYDDFDAFYKLLDKNASMSAENFAQKLIAAKKQAEQKQNEKLKKEKKAKKTRRGK